MLDSCPGAKQFIQPMPDFLKCPAAEPKWSFGAMNAHQMRGVRRDYHRERLQGCIDWCEKAEECLGTELYRR